MIVGEVADAVAVAMAMAVAMAVAMAKAVAMANIVCVAITFWLLLFFFFFQTCSRTTIPTYDSCLAERGIKLSSIVAEGREGASSWLHVDCGYMEELSTGRKRCSLAGKDYPEELRVLPRWDNQSKLETTRRH